MSSTQHQQQAPPTVPPMYNFTSSIAGSNRARAGGSSKVQRIVLTTTSLRNVVLANSSDVIYYEVITPKWARDSTTVSRLDPNTHQFDVVGEMRNDTHGKAAEVKLYGGATRSVKEFLLGEDVEGGGKSDIRRASFVGKDGKKYTWKASQKSLELVREDMPEDQPVAVYHREKRFMHLLRMSQHPYLEVSPAAMDTLDSLIREYIS